MAKIPDKIKQAALVQLLVKAGKLNGQGKVRDSYKLTIKGKEFLLLVASDRISIFDFVLPALVPHKGEVLTALTNFWLTSVLEGYPHHLVDSEKFELRNMAYDLSRGMYPDIDPARSLLVKIANIPPYEMIYRRHLGGSVFKKYQETGVVAGKTFPPNLPKWSRLDEALFTPSTKADEGHDINISQEQYYLGMEGLGQKAEGKASVKFFSKVYNDAYEYAAERGILILDTKFEGLNMLADEVLTPDSSRFTTDKDWQLAIKEGRDPIFQDKEPVRIWGKLIETPFGVTGIQKLNPDEDAHVEFVHSLTVPAEIINEATRRYQGIFTKLTGYGLEVYQKEFMV